MNNDVLLFLFFLCGFSFTFNFVFMLQELPEKIEGLPFVFVFFWGVGGI